MSIGLGVGVSTAIFGAVNRVLLSALPYPDAERIVVLTDRDRNGAPFEVAYGNYVEIAQRSRWFEALAVTYLGVVALLGAVSFVACYARLLAPRASTRT